MFKNDVAPWVRWNQDFLTVLVSPKDHVSSLVMADLFNLSHEYLIVAQAALALLHLHFLVRLLLQQKHRGLSSISWLEGVWVKVNRRDHPTVFENPLPDVAQARRSQYRVR